LTEASGDCVNDMVVDARGGAYIGTRNLDMDVGSPEAIDTLIYVTPDGQMSTVAEGVTSPNGSVLIGNRLIVAETYAHRLLEFRQEDDGTLVDRRVFAETGELYPDGIWNDAEGCIWVGSPFTGQFGRVMPGGRITDEFRVASKIGVACTLGGDDNRTLFLCCAGEKAVAKVWSEEAGKLVADPNRPTSSGAIYAVEVSVPAA
jgi:sugar lactone lactonase YvrE